MINWNRPQNLVQTLAVWLVSSREFHRQISIISRYILVPNWIKGSNLDMQLPVKRNNARAFGKWVTQRWFYSENPEGIQLAKGFKILLTQPLIQGVIKTYWKSADVAENDVRSFERRWYRGWWSRPPICRSIHTLPSYFNDVLWIRWRNLLFRGMTELMDPCNSPLRTNRFCFYCIFRASLLSSRMEDSIQNFYPYTRKKRTKVSASLLQWEYSLP